jgi:hypothetical protein
MTARKKATEYYPYLSEWPRDLGPEPTNDDLEQAFALLLDIGHRPKKADGTGSHEALAVAAYLSHSWDVRKLGVAVAKGTRAARTNPWWRNVIKQRGKGLFDLGYVTLDEQINGGRQWSIALTDKGKKVVADYYATEGIELFDPDLDEALEEAAMGSAEGVRRLRARGSRMTAAAFVQARQRAEATGRGGELLLNDWLRAEVMAGRLASVRWMSEMDVCNPWDFEVERTDQTWVRIEVKTTNQGMDRKFHISQAEVENAADPAAPPTDLYRLYDFDGTSANLAIASDIRDVANGILDAVAKLAPHVTPDGYTVAPAQLEGWKKVGRI